MCARHLEWPDADHGTPRAAPGAASGQGGDIERPRTADPAPLEQFAQPARTTGQCAQPGQSAVRGVRDIAVHRLGFPWTVDECVVLRLQDHKVKGMWNALGWKMPVKNNSLTLY